MSQARCRLKSVQFVNFPSKPNSTCKKCQKTHDMYYQNYFDHQFIKHKYNVVHVVDGNPCPAELLQLYFSSFEAGIANAIASFK